MDYSALSKSQLWGLVKDAKLQELTWQSSKAEMIQALVNLETENNSTKVTEVVIPQTDDFSLWDNLISDVVPDTKLKQPIQLTIEQAKEKYSGLTRYELWEHFKTDYPNLIEDGDVWIGSSEEMMSSLLINHATKHLKTEATYPELVQPWENKEYAERQARVSIEAVTTQLVKPIISDSATSKYFLSTYILKTVLAEYIALTVYLYHECCYIAKTLLAIKLVVTPVKLFSWHYIDHAMSGGYKPVKDKYDKLALLELLETLNSILPDVKQFDYVRSIVAIKMLPKTIIVDNVNDNKIKRIEKQKQTNNDYANRRRTAMSTNESPGRNVGQASVKESILFKAARFLSEPFIRDGKANIDKIDTISVNGVQVYPCSLISSLPEDHPAIEKLSPASIKFLFNFDKKDDPLTESQLAEVKIYKRRREIAEKKVSQRSFSHLRGKINNGFSPAFKDNNKTFCFELDKQNRIRLWSLPDNTEHNVSANDLMKGRLLQDVGYLEVLSFTQPQWRNLTLDMVKGGSEARLERFNWISEKLNLVSLDNVEQIKHFLTTLTATNGQPLVIEDLRVSKELISGELYGSKLLIGKRDVKKHKVVLHPNARCPERIVAVANTWVLSLPGNLLNQKYVLGLNNITTKTRISDCEKPNRNIKPISNKSDLKYIIRMLTKFSTEGIYLDREKTQYLGKLVLTDGSELLEKKITRIAQRILDSYPPTERLAVLFTPTLLVNNDNYTVTLLRVLRTYGDVELSVLKDGKLTHYNSDTDIKFTQWCNAIYRYLMSYGKAVTALTLNDAIQMLVNSPFSEHKQTLINGIPTKAKLNGQLMLKDCTD